MGRSDLLRFFQLGARGFGSDAFEPNFPPIGVNAPGTEETAFAVSRLAHYRIEYDARCFDFSHFSRSIIHDSFDAPKDAIGTTAVWDFFCVKPEATIPAAGIQRFEDLLVGLNPHEF